MSKLHKQTAKLVARIVENLPEMDGDIMQGWIDNPRGLQKFLRGLCPPEATAPKEETPLDTIIRVDRSVRPVYPDWVREVMHPELEAVGPTKYDLAKQVELYLFRQQLSSGQEMGSAIYNHLKKTDSLKNCLGLHDALEIWKMDVEVFKKFFGYKSLYCWKSVVRSIQKRLFVPYVYSATTGEGDLVVVRWAALAEFCPECHPAVRFIDQAAPMS